MRTGESLYPYADGARLDQRNTYFFAPFHREALLQAWCDSRALALAEMTAAPAAAVIYEVSVPDGATAQLLETVAEGLDREGKQAPHLLDALVQRFEVTKRVHGAYDARMRPVEAADFRDLRLYVRLAELAERGYVMTGELPYLNVLLKLLDTLCACRDFLEQPWTARVGKLIECERAHVASLSGQVGVPPPC